MIRKITDTLYHKKYTTIKQKTYLDSPDEPRPRLFYLLPKIHKPPGTWTVPAVVPVGRPIVSDGGSESYRITEYIDHFITPIFKLHLSYIKDTYEFVNKIKNLQVHSPFYNRFRLIIHKYGNSTWLSSHTANI